MLLWSKKCNVLLSHLLFKSNQITLLLLSPKNDPCCTAPSTNYSDVRWRRSRWCGGRLHATSTTYTLLYSLWNTTCLEAVDSWEADIATDFERSLRTPTSWCQYQQTTDLTSRYLWSASLDVLWACMTLCWSSEWKTTFGILCRMVRMVRFK